MSQSAIASVQRIEEETIYHYEALRYYPVHIGQTFHKRYEVAVKLGFGGSSTVWLCHDKRCMYPKSVAYNMYQLCAGTTLTRLSRSVSTVKMRIGR